MKEILILKNVQNTLIFYKDNLLIIKNDNSKINISYSDIKINLNVDIRKIKCHPLNFRMTFYGYNEYAYNVFCVITLIPYSELSGNYNYDTSKFTMEDIKKTSDILHLLKKKEICVARFKYKSNNNIQNFPIFFGKDQGINILETDAQGSHYLFYKENLTSIFSTDAGYVQKSYMQYIENYEDSLKEKHKKIIIKVGLITIIFTMFYFLCKILFWGFPVISIFLPILFSFGLQVFYRNSFAEIISDYFLYLYIKKENVMQNFIWMEIFFILAICFIIIFTMPYNLGLVLCLSIWILYVIVLYFLTEKSIYFLSALSNQEIEQLINSQNWKKRGTLYFFHYFGIIFSILFSGLLNLR